MALQAITVEDRSFERAKNGTDFVREYIFPGGCLPSLEAITRSLRRATPMLVVDVEDIGRHYAETLRRWDERVTARADAVTALGLDTRFQRLWHFYLCYCEGRPRAPHLRRPDGPGHARLGSPPVGPGGAGDLSPAGSAFPQPGAGGASVLLDAADLVGFQKARIPPSRPSAATR